MTESSIHRNGRELVTITEFAKRLGITRPAVYRALKKGLLFTTSVNGSSSQWLDWESQKVQYSTIKTYPQKSHINIRKMPEPKVPKIESMKSDSIEEASTPNAQEAVDINKINPYDYPDCWLIGDSGPAINPETKKPMLDYDKLKAYLTSVKYQLDIKKLRGELIEKKDVAFAIQDAMTILSTELESIPRKFTESILAFCEYQMHQKLSEDNRKMLSNMLDAKPTEIMASIRKAFEDYIA